MAFNKKMTTFSLTLASTLLLAACGGGDTDTETTSSTESTATSEVAAGELQDGTYKLVEKNLDDNGWKVDFSITVEDGVITESNYDNLNEAGESKLEDEGYQTAMAEKTDGVGPQQYIPELNEQLVEKQDAAEVEVVTGATHSSDSFKEYAQQLIDAAKEGNTETIEIDN
ncbi:FMN-binding protein [Jeotgalibaca caeni]|uniref:FMN-binding protein n=1 Tax=Jeotgalibaca caeni TaxID=3028623 RepID=UPI00237E5E76|nr:FMN-binding protein [Jeotgalibaca caeni]MDE1548573.1 FMN-binding protein [Jeotgalibaca caeni]